MCNTRYELRKLDSRWSMARKQHECCACHEAIRVGDRYHVATLLNESGSQYDRYVEKAKHCARCYAIIEALWKSGAKVVELGLDCGKIWEQPPDEVAALAFWLPGDEAPQNEVA